MSAWIPRKRHGRAATWWEWRGHVYRLRLSTMMRARVQDAAWAMARAELDRDLRHVYIARVYRTTDDPEERRRQVLEIAPDDDIPPFTQHRRRIPPPVTDPEE